MSNSKRIKESLFGAKPGDWYTMPQMNCATSAKRRNDNDNNDDKRKVTTMTENSKHTKSRCSICGVPLYNCRCGYKYYVPSLEDVLPSNKASDKQVSGNHYKLPFMQPGEFITKNNIPYIEGNVIKYVCRHTNKNGSEDIKKAIHYLELLLEWEYGDDDK